MNVSHRQPPLRIRIGIMLRGIDEIDGPGVYIRDLCEALFDLDQRNEYIVFYRKSSQSGRFAHRPNVAERIVRASNKLLWDQVAVPIAVWRENLDVLFHHKFTIPVLSPCPTVVQQRGAEYWTFPEWYDWTDRFYATHAIPIYCRVATRVVTNSNSLAEDLSPYIDVPREEIETVYAAPDSSFRRVSDSTILNEVRERYDLPKSPFFLMVAKGYAAVGSDSTRTYPRKNVDGVISAYQVAQRALENCPPLVVAGPGFGQEAIQTYKTRMDRSSVVHFPGYVDYSDMPAIYSMSHSLVFPSYSESFGIPLVEAMACGCPVIAANTGACPEIVARAGLLVDPRNSDDIAHAMIRMAEDTELRSRLVDLGHERASDFSWHRSAEKLLDILQSAAKEG